MRVFVGWVIALGLVALPAMAGRPRDGKNGAADASKTKDANADKTMTSADSKTDAAAKTETTNFATEVQQLRDLIVSQSKELESTREQLQQDQHRIELLENALKTSHEAPAAASISATGVLATPSSAAPPATIGTPAVAPVSQPNNGPEEQKGPLSFRIGGAEFTPGGFLDFTSIFRSTNTGNLGTSFGAIPFSNTVQGHLTEERFMVSNSRISLKVAEKFGQNDVTGYYEMDFLGNDATNVLVTSNSHTFRSRLYFVDVKRDKFEVAAGQMWSWLTPNRVGVSPMPADIFYSQNMDTNYQVGLTWTRAPQFRVVYHPNEHWALGVALENPEQYTGLGNVQPEVTFPNFFNATLSGQFDAANNSNTPNLHPDVIPKISYDTDLGGKHFHAEAAGLLTSVKITFLSGAIPRPSGFSTNTKTGGGISGAVNLEFLKNVRFVGNGFWSDGGGRYIFGLGPDAVVKPIVSHGAAACVTVGFVTTGCDVTPSLVHSGSGIVGIEAQVTPTTMFAGYFGGAYFQRNAFPDPTHAPGLNPISCGPHLPATLLPCIGFGGTNSSVSNNRAITEPSFDWIQTFWKDPQYGALQLITEVSYVTRSPWFVAAGAPKNAHLTMAWVDLRYILP